ncbi:GEVED domain-containing protein [Dokdonia sp. Hel_I_53]|uniref:GEVED domain-containing protein n=1 Tax=Dokdonia sp. Hel_I_53 TaxID=1566287 RepID=UPI00119BE895|nr:GEVED domain-containing protein [Dokdonia sp. Hel_I_53]TVZ53181.1 putative secreted protein (Por secretion system target) [Dokdonia sp. Hel_I_53]
MKKTITLILFNFLFACSLFAQQDRECATMENLALRQSQDSDLLNRMAEIESFTEKKILEMKSSQNRNAATVISIPVVVHVIYSNSNENISDAQILSQIQVLNDDFRRQNSDADNTWSQAADTQIEFCLATVDPNGNATNGITRKSSSRTSWGTNDDMKRASQGGVNPWNTSEYLNMWVCNIGGGTLGYAQFPGGSSATDGVVMGPQYFGTSDAGSGFYLSAPFDKGRTTTHEVGHFFNLRHIWGDSNCGNDFVSDTPTHQSSNGGCPVGQVSCSSTDMVQNYMDYTNDTCMNLFTLGQKNRMRAVLEAGGVRSSLASSNKCGAVAQPTCTDGVQNGDETGIDCGGSSCTPCQTAGQYCASQGNSVNDEYISRVQVGSINNASGTQLYSDFTSTSTDLNKGSNYTITVTPTWTGTAYSEGYAAWIDYNEDGDFLDSGELIFSKAASTTSPATGTFTVPSGATNGDKRLRISMKYNGIPTSCETFDYGEVEDYTVTIKTGVTNPPAQCSGAISSFPYNESFESGFGAWTQASGDDFNWTRTSGSTPSGSTGPSSASDGSQYVFMESSTPNYATKRAILTSPCFDLTSQSDATLSFDYHMYGAASMGNLKLALSTDSGTTWSTVWTKSGNQGNSWQTATINLSSYAGSSIKLRFDGTTGTTWQGDMAVDAISIADVSTPADKCAGVAPYNSTQSYFVGDQVTYQGNLYERTSTGWTNLGACGTARIASEGSVQYLDVQVSVYPNPVSGNTLFIESNVENLSFTVVNLLGQKVSEGSSNTGIDVGRLEAGLYLIQFNVNGKTQTRKFIKK